MGIEECIQTKKSKIRQKEQKGQSRRKEVQLARKKE